jgi:hypothetical protein
LKVLHAPRKSAFEFFEHLEGSLAEVGYCVHVAHRLGYVTDALAAELESDIKRAMAPLVGLIRAEQLKVGSMVVALMLIACAVARLV